MAFKTIRQPANNESADSDRPKVDWEALNKYVVETANLQQRETLLGYISGIVDLGVQSQNDSEVEFNGSEQDEADEIEDNPGTYFKDGKNEKGKDVRLKCWKNKPVQSNRNTFIPLPNIDIPWEATEDSVSPVADGTHIIAKEACGYTHQIKANSNNLYWNTKPITGNQIVSYKIIDEEYLPKQDNTKEVEAPKVHTFTWQQPVTITLPDNPNLELIKHLEFLQILTNKFPEIKDKVVELMEVELDAWWHSTFEENNDD